MPDKTGPYGIHGHMTVRLGKCILVFGGCGMDDERLSTRIIWMYNLYTEKWKKYEVPNTLEAPPSYYGASAVAIGPNVYMLDGRNGQLCNPDNALWKLTRTPDGNIFWNRIISIWVPSYRSNHSGWDYEDKLWTFGGYVHPLGQGIGCCNELLCFNPSRNKWTRPKSSGSVPSPRMDHATSLVKDKSWVFGGISHDNWQDDLFQLDMKSITWTEILTAQPRPHRLLHSSLNAITESKLLLCGSIFHPSGRNIWILDVNSQSWIPCDSVEDDSKMLMNHTGITGLNNCVIIIGGQHRNCTTFYIRLEPKTLQQLATQIIYKHRTLVQWQCLPNKLISQLGF